MINIIESKIIGPLIQDESFPDWWLSESVSIPFFDGTKLPVIFMDFDPKHDLNFIIDADNALTEFFKLDSKMRIVLSSYVLKTAPIT